MPLNPWFSENFSTYTAGTDLDGQGGWAKSAPTNIRISIDNTGLINGGADKSGLFETNFASPTVETVGYTLAVAPQKYFDVTYKFRIMSFGSGLSFGFVSFLPANPFLTNAQIRFSDTGAWTLFGAGTPTSGVVSAPGIFTIRLVASFDNLLRMYINAVPVAVIGYTTVPGSLVTRFFLSLAKGGGAQPNRFAIDDIVAQYEVLAAVPTAPVALIAVASAGAVTLSWTPPSNLGSGPITNYRIYRAINPGVGTGDLLTTIGNITGYLDTSVTSGVTYYYRVVAVNGSGDGPLSNEAFATPFLSVPATPQNIIAIQKKNFAIISWNPVTTRADHTPANPSYVQITKYNIYKSRQMNENDQFLYKVIDTPDAHGMIDTAHVDVDIADPKVYRISAIVIEGPNVLESDLSERAVALRLPSQIDDKVEIPDLVIGVFDESTFDQSVFA